MTRNSKWRMVTDCRSKAFDHVYVEFKDSIPTNRQKCSHVWQCKSTTTTSLTNHWQICSTKGNNNPNQPDIGNAIQIQQISSSQDH